MSRACVSIFVRDSIVGTSAAAARTRGATSSIDRVRSSGFITSKHRLVQRIFQWLKNVCELGFAGGTRFARHVADAECAAWDVGLVHIGSVKEPVVKQRDLAGAQFKMHDLFRGRVLP